MLHACVTVRLAKRGRDNGDGGSCQRERDNVTTGTEGLVNGSGGLVTDKAPAPVDKTLRPRCHAYMRYHMSIRKTPRNEQ